MAQAHDGAGAVFFGGPGADFEFCGKIFFFDDQRMITGGRHRHGKALKDGLIVVHDWAGLAVHEVRGADDASAEGFADGLMARHTPRTGTFPAKWRMSSMLMPASCGVHGPGETTMRSGRRSRFLPA